MSKFSKRSTWALPYVIFLVLFVALPLIIIIPFPLPHRYHSDSILYLYRRLRRTILLEKCEMYASVATLFYKVWMVVKVIGFRVFQYEISAIFQYPLFKNQVGQSG